MICQLKNKYKKSTGNSSNNCARKVEFGGGDNAVCEIVGFVEISVMFAIHDAFFFETDSLERF